MARGRNKECSVSNGVTADLHDCGNLSGHHRENLNLNTVELIQTRPGTSLCQPTEHLACHLVVHTITAVEDNDIPSQGLSKVLQQPSNSVSAVCNKATKPAVQATAKGATEEGSAGVHCGFYTWSYTLCKLCRTGGGQYWS